LPRSCSQCGTANDADARFCKHCGEPIAAAGRLASTAPRTYTPLHLAEKILRSRHALEGERKQVTVLFCDIANSTALAERLGPEPMHALLNGFFSLALGEIHRYEGTINQFLGDGFMGLFGAPVAHEDHARRAVLAALGIQRALREGQLKEGGPDLRVRIGLNTGPVVVGTIGDNLRMDYTAVGDTTNVAARLQQAAQPGSVLVSEATSRLVKGYVVVEPLAPLPVKGKADPLTAFSVVGLGTRRSPLGRHEDRALSRFVGREREMAILGEALSAVEAGRGRVLSITGEAGVGKSRVVHEFKRLIEDRPVTVLEGQCVSFGRTVPYLPLQDVVRENCGITENDVPGEIGEKVRRSLQQVGMDPNEGSAYLLQLLGVKEGTEPLAYIGPETIKARIFETLRELAIRGSRRRPLVVVLEDLQWSDKTSEECIAEIADAVTEERVLLLTTFRPEYRALWTGKPNTTEVVLSPLSRADSLSVVQSTIQRALAQNITDMILGKGDGNPFFLEELARTVLEPGAEGRGAVPDTIQDVLMARIDRLPDESKSVLQSAAVLGREFPLRLLKAVHPEGGSLAARLAELASGEFVYERTGAGEPVYAFKHALTQEVAYDSLLSGRRQALHGAAGDALESMATGRLEEHYERLAHHFSRSRSVDKALQYLHLANRKAAKANAMIEAKAYFNEAMALLDTLPDVPQNARRRVALLVDQFEVMFLLLTIEEWYGQLRSHEESAAALREPGLVGMFYTRLAACQWFFGELDAAVARAMSAADLLKAAESWAVSAQAHVIAEWSQFYKADYGQVLAHRGEAVQLLERQFDLKWHAWALGAAAWAYACLGRWDEAFAEGQRELEVATRFGDQALISHAAWVLSVSHILKGDLGEALRYADMSIASAPTLADRAFGLGFKGAALCRLGAAEQGLDVEHQIVGLMASVGFLWGENVYKLFLGHGYWRAGRPNEARQTLEELIETTGRVGIRFLNGIGERLLGEIATASPEEAASHFQRSIAILSDIGATNELAHALRGYGRVLRAQGRVADAREHLTRALESFERLGTPNEPDLLRTELDSLGSGYGSHASGAAAAPGGREPGRDRPGFRPDNERSR
jgi:class 3 adenylate cyclase